MKPYPGRLALALILALFTAQCAIAQQGSAQIVWQAWANTINVAKKLPSYELVGKSQSYSGPGTTHPASSVPWKSIVDGPRYHVEWTSSGGGIDSSSQAQSFDGKLWYGTTERGNDQSGLVTDNPIKATEVSMDEQLNKVSAGIFYPTATQIFTMFENFDGQNLLTSYLRVAKDVKVTINGTEVTLELSHEDATKYNLPDEMILRFVGSNLCPIKTVIEPRGNSVSITREAKRFEQYGSGFEYPTEMVITFVDGSNGGKKVIFHSKISLKISAFDVSQYSFAIKFAPQASIASVVNGKTRVYTNNASNPSAGREYWFVGVGAGMLAGGGLWLAKRKRG